MLQAVYPTGGGITLTVLSFIRKKKGLDTSKIGEFDPFYQGAGILK